jgi:poly(A) polymerase
VAPGTLDEDIRRRDFTVNALCRTMHGDIVDRTGRGLADLRAGVLRTPLDPHETFSEDPLRMFRAARFVAQLGLTLADGVLDAIRTEASRASILSVERVAEELRRLLTCANPRQGLEVLRDGGLLDVVMPEAMEMVGVEQGGWHIYDVFDHASHTVAHAPADLITRTAALFHDIGKPRTHVVAADGRHTFHNHAEIGATMAAAVLARLRFSNDEVESVVRLVRMHMRPIQYSPATHSDSAVRRLIRDIGALRPALLDLARADTHASRFPTAGTIDELDQRMTALDRDGELSAMVSTLNGEEIMAMAQRPPGRWVGDVKRALEDAVIEGQIGAGDAEAARRWLDAHPELLSAD